MTDRKPYLDERDFKVLFPTARPWDYKHDKDTVSMDNGRRRWDRLIQVSPFMSVEPRRFSSLYVTHSPVVVETCRKYLCDEERDQISFKAIEWPEGYAIWLSNHLIIGGGLLAIVDKSTMPLFKVKP